MILSFLFPRGHGVALGLLGSSRVGLSFYLLHNDFLIAFSLVGRMDIIIGFVLFKSLVGRIQNRSDGYYNWGCLVLNRSHGICNSGFVFFSSF